MPPSSSGVLGAGDGDDGGPTTWRRAPRRLWRMVRERWAYLLALAPVLTDWLDTGHLPAHPREYVTEAVLGAVITGCVWLLYRDARRLVQLAATDGLTGLRNRRKFHEDLAREMARARRLGVTLSLAYVDVDRFKSINDTHGHGVGDRVLKMVAAALGQLRGDIDRGYRLGGDEFAAILPGADAESALSAMERCLEHGSADAPRELPHVGLSIGTVQMTEDDTLDRLVARADRAMYAAKQGASSDALADASFRRIALGGTQAAAFAGPSRGSVRRRLDTPGTPSPDSGSGR